MNDQQLNQKVRQDAVKVKKDFDILAKDSLTRLNRFQRQASRLSKDIAEQADDILHQLRKRYRRIEADARKVISRSPDMVKKEIRLPLISINRKTRKGLSKSPGFLRQAGMYALMLIPVALAVGFLVSNSAHHQAHASSIDDVQEWMMQ